MANPTRVLFVSGEVDPFARQSDIADLVRMLPEKLQETNDYEIRLMMPRFGTISERRNRLHEVIRLSGTEVKMGDARETLKVKVASIPGVRLQVYFMDNNRYFKRKGIYADRQNKAFEDNPARALFFARASLETIRKLGWAPDVVHAFGWLSALIPFLVRTEYANDPLFDGVKVIFTPCGTDVDGRFTQGEAEALELPAQDQLVGRPLEEIALDFADAAVYPPAEDAAESDDRLSCDPAEMISQASALYSQTLTGIAA